MSDFGNQDVYTLQIKRHKRASDIVSPNCEACQKGFLHVNSLQVREFTQTGKLPGVCKSCNTTFLKICRIQIRNMSQTEQHYHNCDICGKSFTHAGNYMKHKRLHDMEEQLRVAKTESNAENSTMAVNEITVAKAGTKIPPVSSSNVMPRPKAPYECEKCGKVFVKYGSYMSHLDGHENQLDLLCPICEKTCSTRASYKLHVERCKSRQAVYVCQYCENTFTTKSDLKTHLITTHALTSEPNVCKFCKQTFTVAEELESHLLKHLSDHGRIDENKPEEKKFNHFCVECNKGFVYLKKLENHLKTHDSKLPFECSTCKKQFVHPGRLKSHMKLHNRRGIKNWPYKCNVCNKRCTSSRDLNKHKSTHKF